MATEQTNGTLQKVILIFATAIILGWLSYVTFGAVTAYGNKDKLISVDKVLTEIKSDVRYLARKAGKK